ncbi:MAG: methyltransferase domain-containing protein [Victivallaceae bacterium]|nr:methyltransferase domain-containing protein [Victivallaceae bacterium]
MVRHDEDAGIALLTGRFERFDPGEGAVELDLGCGSGSFTVALARRFPQKKILAADVMIGRLRKLVRHSHRDGVENIEILRVEARVLVARMLPDRSLDRIHLLCPDPWPKERHRGNRLLCSDFTTQLHRVLKENGIFHFSSDDENYCAAVGRILEASQLFEGCDEAIADVGDLTSDFEKRWREQGKAVWHRAWKRLALPRITIGH